MLSIILSFLIISSGPDVGTSGFNFIKIVPSARQAAMANTSIGLETDGGFGFFYNPALNVSSPKLELSYLNYLAGISIGSVGYSKLSPFSFLNSGGIGITYLNSGKIKRTDINGSELGVFSVSYLNLNAAGTMAMMNDDLKLGLGLKILYGSIDSFVGIGFGVDLGARYKPAVKGLTLGAVVKNLGFQVKAFDEEKDRLPLDIGVGAGYDISNDVTVALDIHKPIDNSVLVNFGIEGWINKYVALRGGYNSLGGDYKTGSGSDILAGFSAGLGVKLLKYRVDYGFTPMGSLGQTHHITLFLSL